jgi:hypothetical protein
MQQVFSFFFRFLLAFLAAKFLARFFGLQGWGSLLGLTALFLVNIYLFDYLDYRSRTSWRRQRNLRQEPSAAASPPPEDIPPES